MSTCALVLGLAGCTMDTDPSEETVHADVVPQLVLQEERRIGSVEDPDYGFSGVGSVRVDARGNIYVYETQDREIRVYSPSGQLLRRIGRPGDGPGEFSSQTVSFGIYADTLWVVESFARRFTLFTTDGLLIRTVVLERVSVPLHTERRFALIVPMGRDTGGLFIGDMGHMVQLGQANPASPVTDTAQILRVRFDNEGRVVDTVGSYPLARPAHVSDIVQAGGSRYAVPRPASSEPRYLATTDGTIRIDQALPPNPPTIQVSRIGHDGLTERTTVLSYQPVRYPSEVLDAMAANAVRRAHQVAGVSPGGPLTHTQHPLDSAAGRIAIRSRLADLEYQAPVQGQFLTEDGRLWLRRENLGDPTTRWTVLNDLDVPVGEVALSRTARIAWVRDNRVLTVERDTFDVPWIVAYTVRPM